MKSLTLVLLLVLGISGSAFAQQTKDQPQPGRFQVIPHQLVGSMQGVILLDTWTGRTWKLVGGNAWHPIPKVETPAPDATAKPSAPTVDSLADKLRQRQK